MTFVAIVKTGGGFVLGADSGAVGIDPDRLVLGEPRRQAAVMIHRSAYKIAPLRGRPVATVNMGASTLNGTCVHELITRFDRELPTPGGDEGKTLEPLAVGLASFLAPHWHADSPCSARCDLTVFLAGYAGLAGELWAVKLLPGQRPIAQLLKSATEGGCEYGGAGAAAFVRLVGGFASRLPDVVAGHLGLTPEAKAGLTRVLVSELRRHPPLSEETPLNHVEEWVDFLLDTACTFETFTEVIPTVCRPIELARIRPTAGFEWIRHSVVDRTADPNEVRAGTRGRAATCR